MIHAILNPSQRPVIPSLALNAKIKARGIPMR
jgi:hypothetical protein